MKIVDVKTYMIDVPPPHWGGRHWIFVKLVTDEGIEGIGECTYHTRLNHVVIELIKDWGERFLKGTDPFRIEKIWSTLYEGPCVRHSGPLVTPAMSAIEMACWDIVGKAVNQPIYNLLGGMFHEKLRAYSYLLEWRNGDSPEKTGELVLLLRRKRIHRCQIRSSASTYSR